MADYWKSNDRKFCDICKCWFGDNRISIEIHEKGKGHQENVKLKLREVAKKGKADADAEKEKDAILRMIDEKAKEALRKDIKEARVARALEMTSRLPARKWCLAYADGNDGETVPYYWNLDSSETRWDEPTDGYYSIDEQKLLGLIEDPDRACVSAPSEAAKPESASTKSDNVPTYSKKEESTQKPRSEKRKEKDRHRPASPEPPNVIEDKPKVHAAGNIGKWTTVEVPEPEPVHFQPIIVTEEVPLAVEEPRPKKFQEKTISSLSRRSSGAPVFKKRKMAGNRSLKQREDV